MKPQSIFFYKSTKKKVYDIVKDLVNFINVYIKKNQILKKLFYDLSLILNVPKEILEKRSKQILFKSYEFEKKRFNTNYNLINVFYDFIFLICFLIIFLINGLIYKKNKRKKVDLICDNIYTKNDFNRHKYFSNYFNSILLIGYKNLDFKHKKTEFINIRKDFFKYTDFSFTKRIFLIFFIFKIFLYSIFFRMNLIYIFRFLIYDFIKYKRLYSEYDGKYYFNYRFYDTNVLQNYLFKKNGGLKTSCFQKNICTLSLSCFVYSDIFFSLGNYQGEICNKLGGEIKFFKPVGSFVMENNWFKRKKDFSKIPNIDILILGINAPWPRGCINNDYHNSYYKKFLPWIKKISSDFPNKKIFYKHHNDFLGDSRETNILSDSNIEIIIGDKSINSSYAWAFKSKIVLSFASTMIVELLGNNKEAYFIDPDGINDQWYYGINNIKRYRINTYNNLKKIIKRKYKKKNISIKNRNFYCLNSKNTKKNISKYLKV